jgi:hypothetical protein
VRLIVVVDDFVIPRIRLRDYLAQCAATNPEEQSMG